MSFAPVAIERNFPKEVVERNRRIIHDEMSGSMGLEELRMFVITNYDAVLAACRDDKTKKFISTLAGNSYLIDEILSGNLDTNVETPQLTVEDGDTGESLAGFAGQYNLIADQLVRQKLARSIRFKIVGGAAVACVAAAMTYFVSKGGLKVVSAALLNSAAKIRAQGVSDWKVTLIKIAGIATIGLAVLGAVNFKKYRGLSSMQAIGLRIWDRDFSYQYYAPWRFNTYATVQTQSHTVFPPGYLFPGNYKWYNANIIYANILCKCFKGIDFFEDKALNMCNRVLQFGACVCDLVHIINKIYGNTLSGNTKMDYWALIWDDIEYLRKGSVDILFKDMLDTYAREGIENIYTILANFQFAARAHLANPDLTDLQLDKLITSAYVELYWAACVRNWIFSFYVERYFRGSSYKPDIEAINSFNRDILSMLQYLERWCVFWDKNVILPFSVTPIEPVATFSYKDHPSFRSCVVDVYRKQVEGIFDMANGRYKNLVDIVAIEKHWHQSTPKELQNENFDFQI